MRQSELGKALRRKGWLAGMTFPAHLGGREVARNMRPLNIANSYASDWKHDIKSTLEPGQKLRLAPPESACSKAFPQLLRKGRTPPMSACWPSVLDLV